MIQTIWCKPMSSYALAKNVTLMLIVVVMMYLTQMGCDLCRYFLTQQVLEFALIHILDEICYYAYP